MINTSTRYHEKFCYINRRNAYIEKRSPHKCLKKLEFELERQDEVSFENEKDVNKATGKILVELDPKYFRLTEVE